MRWTVRSSLRYRYLVVVLGALTMALGIVTLPSARVDVFPEFAPPRVVVQTACLGLSTSDVEQLVSVPLEEAFNGIDGLDELRSKSVPQLSSVELIFDSDVDLLHARQLVAERMSAVSADAADLGRPAGDARSGVGDRAGVADRDDVEGPLAHRDVHDGVLDDPGPTAPGAWCGERGAVERAPADDDGAGRPRTAWRNTTSASTR